MKATTSNTYDMRYGSLYLGALICFGTTATADTVHRWKDENGVVNYGNAPPTGVRSTPVPTMDPLKVTRPPGAPDNIPAAAARPPDGLDRGAVRDEVEQALRQQSATQAADAQRQDEAARLAAKRRCEAQRRVDCDDYPWADSHFDGPPVVVRRRNDWVNPYPPVYRPNHPPSAPSQPVERPALMRKLP